MAGFTDTKAKGTAAPSSPLVSRAASAALNWLPGSAPAVDPTRYVTTPADPIEYANFRTGPDSSIEYEPNLSRSVDGSDGLLRSLSPFVIRVEPPLVFGEMGGFLNQNANQINVNAFTSAGATAAGYSSARNALLNRGLGPTPVQGQAVDPRLVGLRNDQRNQGKLGEPAIADILTAKDAFEQLQAAVNAPPLVLLINPSSLKTTYSKIQQFQDRTRYGYLFHAHGEEQPKLSMTAKCGVFYLGGQAVSSASKRDSIAWQNLMNAFTFYKNNGYIYDTFGKSNAHQFIGGLSISYDQWVYYGHMDSFTWSFEENTANGGIEFSIEFTVSAMSDNATPPATVVPMKAPTPNPEDARYGYGALVNNSVSSVGSSGVNLTVSVSNGFGAQTPNPVPGAWRTLTETAPQGDRAFGVTSTPVPFGSRR